MLKTGEKTFKQSTLILNNLGPSSKGKSSKSWLLGSEVKSDYNSQETLRPHPLRTLDLGDCEGHRARGGGAWAKPRIMGGDVGGTTGGAVLPARPGTR